MFHINLHCNYVNHSKMVLWKRDIDGASIDDKHFPSNFKVEVYFSQVVDGVIVPVVSRSTLPEANLASVGDAAAMIDRRLRPQDSYSELPSPLSVPESPVSARRERRVVGINESCAVCKFPILCSQFGLVVSESKSVHLACANCSKCRQHIGTREVIMGDDGDLQCGLCALDFFDSCAGCGEQLLHGASSTVGNKVFHQRCLKCSLCSRSLQWAGFREVNKTAVCPDGCEGDSVPVAEPSQPAEEEPQVSDAKPVEEPQSVPEPLNCSVCGVTLEAERVLRENDQIFCQRHHDAYISDPCAHCQKPVFDMPLSVEGRRFHAEHLFCASCEQVCTDFVVVDGAVYCRQHCRDCVSCSGIIAPKALVEHQGSSYHQKCLESYPSCATCHVVVVPHELVLQSDVAYHSTCVPPPREPTPPPREPTPPPREPTPPPREPTPPPREPTPPPREPTPPPPREPTPPPRELTPPPREPTPPPREPTPPPPREPTPPPPREPTPPPREPTPPPREPTPPAPSPAPAPAIGSARVCFVCLQPVKTQFLLKGDQYVHEACFTCPSCHLPLRGAYIEISGVGYHSACFVCNVCQQPFAGGQFTPKDGKNYCNTCFENLAPPCAGCHKPVAGGVYFSIGHHKFHQACFVCSVCQNPFPNGQFYLVGENHICAACLPRR
eukprot:TRINITY_DN4670_c0_g1_i2.p1 TRINITY_DN4670_c0_g1~~TRINITY_DN4670_c0_g1_i2.p1  ORF type:complete len:666 (+),score=69.32 TRINITY_DN4670_c0_g1_i2:196-2193(+)